MRVNLGYCAVRTQSVTKRHYQASTAANSIETESGVLVGGGRESVCLLGTQFHFHLIFKIYSPLQIHCDETHLGRNSLLDTH